MYNVTEPSLLLTIVGLEVTYELASEPNPLAGTVQSLDILLKL